VRLGYNTFSISIYLYLYKYSYIYVYICLYLFDSLYTPILSITYLPASDFASQTKQVLYGEGSVRLCYNLFSIYLYIYIYIHIPMYMHIYICLYIFDHFHTLSALFSQSAQVLYGEGSVWLGYNLFSTYLFISIYIFLYIYICLYLFDSLHTLSALFSQTNPVLYGEGSVRLCYNLFSIYLYIYISINGPIYLHIYICLYIFDHFHTLSALFSQSAQVLYGEGSVRLGYNTFSISIYLYLYKYSYIYVYICQYIFDSLYTPILFITYLPASDFASQTKQVLYGEGSVRLGYNLFSIHNYTHIPMYMQIYVCLYMCFLLRRPIKSFTAKAACGLATTSSLSLYVYISIEIFLYICIYIYI